MPTFNLANQIKIVSPVANIDSNYGPYASVQAAFDAIDPALRAIGLTVGVVTGSTITEYWFRSATGVVGDLVQKLGGTLSGSNTGDVTLATNSGLTFSSGQTGLALGTPSSITASSTNSITTNTHTHAVSGLTTSNLSATAGITNAQLANSSVTIGTTTISLGSSSTTLAGITTINSTTIPTSKTLVVTTDKLSVFAATTSAELAGVISDETGSGKLVFATSPTFTTSVLTDSTTFAVFNTTATTVNAFGAATILNIGAATGTTTVGNNLVVTGNLTVQGTTTTLNTETLQVEDKNIELGKVTTPSDATADGGGITLLGATNKTILWDSANANWTSSENWNIVSGKSYKINNASVLNATTLGSSVINSSLTKIGPLSSGTAGFVKVDASGNLTSDSSVYLTANQSITLSGDASGSGNTAITVTVSKSTNLKGGNNTTLLGAIPYQSNTDTTSLLSPNTTTTKKFLGMTGTGTNGAAPTWDVLLNGDIPTTLTGKTYNGLSLTANTTGFSIAGGTTSKTLTVNNSITLAGTDGTTITLPSTTGTVALNNQSFYLGTTLIAINRASAVLALTGITSIDGSAASLTTARSIYGNSFNGTADLTQIIASTYGGTGNGFTKFTGATTTEKTYTLPNVSTTILTTNDTITIAQGGTGQTTAIAAFNALSPATTRGDLITRDATNNIRLAKGSQYQVLTGGATDLTWGAVALNQSTAVTGVLSVANGGTGYSSGTITRKVTSTITGGTASFAVNHTFGTAVVAQVWETASGQVVECQIVTTNANSGTTTFSFNIAPVTGAYSYTIIG